MGFKRRSLLKASAMTLAGWALSGQRWSQQSKQYNDLLAAPAQNKFALLVGINQYGGAALDCPKLRGCLNDLELQRQLLIHRFGFNPENILTLSNRQASRSNVQGAVINHLLKQMGPDDTALFHFSGYGSTIRSSEETNPQRSLVLYDSCDDGDSLQDWPEESLLSLLGALPSDRILTVLDSSYALPPLNISSAALRPRSRPSPIAAPLDGLGQELEAQRQALLAQRGSSRENNGILLRAAQLRNVAVEFESQAGPVGLLTYCLTQQLWQSSRNSSLSTTLDGTIARLQQTLGLDQQPQLANARLQGRLLPKVGFKGLFPHGSAGAVTTVKRDGGIRLWLGGYSAEALAHCQAGAVLRLGGDIPQGQPASYFRIQSRDGMMADATPLRARDFTLPNGISPQGISPQSTSPEVASPKTADPDPVPSPLASPAAGQRDATQLSVTPALLNVSAGTAANTATAANITTAANTVPAANATAAANPPGIASVVAPADIADLGQADRAILRSLADPIASPLSSPVPTSSPAAMAQSEPTPSNTSPQLHQPVQEQIRMIPRDLSLQVGLDDRFDRIERVDATSALTSISSVAVASLRDAPTDYIFGRVIAPSETLLASLPASGRPQELGAAAPSITGITAPKKTSPKAALPEEPAVLQATKYGLLLLNQQVLSATVSANAEAIKTAIQRLQPYLETLRAEKVLQLLENTASSDLPVEVRWETQSAAKGSKPEETALRITQGYSDHAQPIPLAQLSAGDQVRYSIINQSDRPLYVMVLGVNSLGQWLMPFTPAQESSSEDKPTPPPRRSKATITTGNNFNEPIPPGSSIQGEWPVESQKGLTSLYVVAIAAPFNQSYALLSAQKQDLVEAQRLQRLRTPFELSQALLEDLQLASSGFAPVLPTSAEHYSLNTRAWATFRYAYAVG